MVRALPIGVTTPLIAFSVVVLDHYLNVLLKKPRTVRDARVMHGSDIPDVVRSFHREMRQRHGAEGDRGFIRFMLLHREVGMQTIVNVLYTASNAQVYHFEGLHELVLKQTGQTPPTSVLSADQLPVDLTQYRVQRADIYRYNALTSGGSRWLTFKRITVAQVDRDKNIQIWM